MGHIATRPGADTFVPDSRLSPERSLPAAIDDAIAAYGGLVADGGIFSEVSTTFSGEPLFRYCGAEPTIDQNCKRQ